MGIQGACDAKQVEFTVTFTLTAIRASHKQNMLKANYIQVNGIILYLMALKWKIKDVKNLHVRV